MTSIIREDAQAVDSTALPEIVHSTIDMKAATLPAAAEAVDTTSLTSSSITMISSGIRMMMRHQSMNGQEAALEGIEVVTTVKSAAVVVVVIAAVMKAASEEATEDSSTKEASAGIVAVIAKIGVVDSEEALLETSVAIVMATIAMVALTAATEC